MKAVLSVDQPVLVLFHTACTKSSFFVMRRQ